MTFVGQSARRVEDERFLTGRGLFVEDEDRPDQLWAAVVRSPHAHAAINRIDTSAVRDAHIFTWQDIAALAPMPCATVVATVEPMRVPPRPALARDRVRHVGDPVAFVVAASRHAARDAAERVTVDYANLPAVTNAAAALAPGAPLLWPDIPGNLSFRFQKGDANAVRTALAAAAHVVTIENLVNNRLVIAPIETRAAIGRFEDGAFHLFVTAAGVHAIRDQIAGVLGIGTNDVIVAAPDVGGGFGIKNALYPEWVLLLWAARALGRPVKWVEDRAEDFISTAQGRDNITTARLGVDENGAFRALRVETIANLGAYMSGGGPGSSTNAPMNAMGGFYDIPAISMDVRAAFTNTVPIDAYRGAGKPEANYLLERLIDRAARDLRIDPAELRRRNAVTVFPYRKSLGAVIDCGRFAQSIGDAEKCADRAGFPARKAISEAKGLLRGLGLCGFMETARGAPNEGAELNFAAGGTIELRVGTQSNGQGHETTYPQIAADLLGLPPETFRYVQGDTGKIRAGNGHGGARSMHMGGAALARAVKEMLAKAAPTAARLLQARPEETHYANGVFTADGRSVTLAEVAQDTPLDTYVWNLLDLITFPNGCHIAEVEIDPDTGQATLDRYTGVDDYGTLINPMLTLGQVHGGLAQGVGQALLERTMYDPESGQMLSGSLMDYTLPKAADLPFFDIVLTGTPTSANPLGVKGAGQAGAMASPQTVICAILDALAPLGVDRIDMPATSETIWRAIHTRNRS